MKKLLRYFCAVGIIGALSCAPATHDMRREQIRIACVGDSITEGAWLLDPASEAYPSRLQQILGEQFSVGNYGVSGACMMRNADGPYWATKAFRRLFTDAPKPNIVIIMLGANDSKPYNWVFKDEFTKDYLDMIDTLSTLSAGMSILICLPLPARSNIFDISGEVIHEEIIPLITQVAKERGLKLIDCHTPFLTRPDDIPDGVHPNKNGALFLARIVAESIQYQ